MMIRAPLRVPGTPGRRSASSGCQRAPLLVTVMALLGLLIVGQVTAQPADWPSPYDLRYAPIVFDPPEPQRVQLSNGITVYLAEDHTLPLIQGVAYVDAPSVLDPAGKAGLAAFTGAMLREGGASGTAPDDVDTKLEFLAASIEAEVGS